MVAFSRFALLAVATLTSAQSFSGPPAGRPSGIASPSGGNGGRGGHGRPHGSGFAHPTGGFNGPRPTGFPSSGDNDSDIQDLAAFSRSGKTPPFPTGGFPFGFPSGIARPTGGRGHRGGKGHRSGAAGPTVGFPAPDGRPSEIPSAGLPDFTLAKRQASATHGAPVHSRKHGKPSGISTGVVPPNGARPTGARPSGVRPSVIGRPSKPAGTPPAEVEKRQEDEDSEPSRPSGTPRSKPSGARPSGALPPKGTRPTGIRPSGSRPTGAPYIRPSGARPSGRPQPSGFVTSAIARA